MFEVINGHPFLIVAPLALGQLLFNVDKPLHIKGLRKAGRLCRERRSNGISKFSHPRGNE